MKAFFFDLDGTLWDTSDTVVKLWNSVLQVRCKELVMTKEIMSSFMGKNKSQFIDEFFVSLDKDFANDVISEIFAKEQSYLKKHGANMYDDVISTLRKLKNKYKLCIVSNCQYGYLKAFLDYYDMYDIIDDYECAGRTNLSKGENIRLVADRNDIDEVIYVGDTKSDEVAAFESGSKFVYAEYGFGAVENYTAKISCFKELLTLAESL